MKRFLGYIANKVVQATPRSKKVSPDIKSVNPTKLPVSKSLSAPSLEEARAASQPAWPAPHTITS